MKRIRLRTPNQIYEPIDYPNKKNSFYYFQTHIIDSVADMIEEILCYEDEARKVLTRWQFEFILSLYKRFNEGKLRRISLLQYETVTECHTAVIYNDVA